MSIPRTTLSFVDASGATVTANVLDPSTAGLLRSPSLGDRAPAPAEQLGGTVANITSLTYAATVTPDLLRAETFDLTLTGNVTIANPSNPANGHFIKLRIKQDATGGRTITLGSKFRIPTSATTPLAWSSDANVMDIFAAIYNEAADKWDVVSLIPGY
jgi:hypothetical protein